MQAATAVHLRHCRPGDCCQWQGGCSQVKGRRGEGELPKLCFFITLTKGTSTHTKHICATHTHFDGPQKLQRLALMIVGDQHQTADRSLHNRRPTRLQVLTCSFTVVLYIQKRESVNQGGHSCGWFEDAQS